MATCRPTSCGSRVSTTRRRLERSTLMRGTGPPSSTPMMSMARSPRWRVGPTGELSSRGRPPTGNSCSSWAGPTSCAGSGSARIRTRPSRSGPPSSSPRADDAISPGSGFLAFRPFARPRKKGVCAPSSLLLSSRHASIRQSAQDAHREKWGGLDAHVPARAASGPAKAKARKRRRARK